MSLKLTRKQTMSYIDLLAWLVENRTKLEGCRIDNIFSTNLNGIYLFSIHCINNDLQLLIEPGKRIHFTQFNREKTLDSKSKSLRELVRGKVIKKAEIVNRERIVKMCLDTEYIYIELLPKGTLIITDQDNKIKFSLERREFKDRTIRPGEIYKLPTPVSISAEEEKELLKKGSISKILGVPQDLLNILSIRVNTLEDLKEAREKITKLIGEIQNGKIEPCVSPESGTWPIFFEGCAKKSSYNEALDEYFTNLEKHEIAGSVDQSEIKKLEVTISKLYEILNQTKQEADLNRVKGRLIMENYPYVETMMSNGPSEIEINGVKIEIDPSKSIAKNAALYFDKAKELEEKIKKTEETIVELERKKQDLLSKTKEEIESSKVLIRKREWFEKYHWTITKNGYIVIAGRDIDQNESLVKKFLGDDDIFLHADIQGAPATVIKSPNSISDEDLLDAATLAASYSKAWKLGLGSIDVFWVYGKQVSKSPPSGEYLPKGSFMIYGKKNFIKNVKLELTVGINTKEGFRIEVGSFNTISSRCDVYVSLEPGDSDVEKVGERISRIFSRQMGESGIKGLRDEIIKVIPGKSKIKRTSEHLDPN
ncbi:MAG: NFACT family protein [Metallosphaera sp.]